MKLQGGQTPPTESKKLFALVHGFTGVGKTALCCSGPSPLWLYNFDRPAGPILEQLPKHYEINYEAETMDVDGIAKQVATGVLNRFDKFLYEALQANEGTFIVDGFDLFWEYVKSAKLPAGDGNYAKEYADANTYMSSRLRRLGLSKMNVFLTSMSKYVWEGATKESNKVQPEGFKWKDRYITHEIYMFNPENLTQPVVTPSDRPGQTHSAYFARSKVNESLAGSVVPNLSFKLLWRLVFGEPHPEADMLWTPSS